ncbi:hypothetical protein QVD17_05891 [Tagetes erecta]|uniref:Uncharacterized protein n=1 Tax=Tagetes erecta TaxID=13708 RepID=A0AAD8LJJ3_TARER|nr:hypothetical protein QVD17_05891 [Tagetes erecta]
MADFEPPSFSLGLDCETFNDEDNELETLVVDDSEPEDPDPYPKRLRCGFTKAELNSTDKHHVVCTGSNYPPNIPVNKKQHISNGGEAVSTSCDNGSDLNYNLGKYDIPRRVWEHLPKAYCYFFHDDPRIQELVRSRLPNFSFLGNMLNTDLEQPSTSKIDYMGQFRFGESSRQAARTNINKKNSSGRKSSRKSETDEMSQGWVNPKLGVDKVKTKGAVKRKVRTGRQTAGHWLTGSDGKKVYVGKSGQELTGRGAYIQYKKESGLGFKKVKRKYVTKKKK